MADLGGMFDANQVEPSAPMEPLPAGKYLAQIVESEMKETKSGTGKFLKLTFQILDGEHKNKKTWAQLNIINPNNQAAEIARRELSAIAHATGVLTFRDSAALHDIPIAITVKCKKREDNGEMKNEISGYEPKSAILAPPVVTPVSAVASVVAPLANNAPPPWQR